MRVSPLQVFLTYLTLIVACAFAYDLVPGTFKSPISFSDSLYFSVVTITTLGYGDLAPISDFGKFLAAAEALFGVILLGIFLLTVSHQLIYTQDRKRINSGKENLKMQYKFWRRDTVMSLLFLSDPEKPVSTELADKLCNPNDFREYFSEKENERWYAVANNLSSVNHYTIELVKDLELLQRHIETFIAITPISDASVLKKLSGYVSFINRLVKLDLDNYDDQKSFVRDLWSMVALHDFINGEYGRDNLIEAMNEI